MSESERELFAELHGIAERGRIKSSGDFERLSLVCGSRGTARDAWRHAQQCRRASWAEILRHRANIRRQGRWEDSGEALWLAMLVLIGVAKGYAAAILRYFHLVDVLDLTSAPRALDRFQAL